MQRIAIGRFVAHRPCLVASAPLNQQKLYSHESTFKDQSNATSKKVAGIVAVGVGIGLFYKYRLKADAATSISPQSDGFGDRKDGHPQYTMEEVSKHSTIDKRVWIAYRHGVYDVTDFVQKHPGGDQILLGAGSSVEPFWNLYAVHKTPHVLKLLEKFRIGNLVAEEVGSTMRDMNDPFSNDPRRHPILEPRSTKPFNAEPPASILPDSLITQNEFFYVRNHLPVPHIDAKSYELEVEGISIKDRIFTLEALKKFPKHTITATIQCGGNRRSEMMKVKPVRGLSWGRAAIGNAEWSGARLRDVLIAAGIDGKNPKIKHIQFEGFDTDPTSNPYGASIPIEKALSESGDVILAYEMNGEELPRDHGYPVRVVVPGTVGARSVKWLGKIVISEEESQSHWQQNDYKGFAPNIDWDTVDFSKSPAIQDLPVTSAICLPKEDATVKRQKNGKVNVKGYAFSGGGRKIVRVDISVDGGKNWREVDKYESDAASHPRAWGWTLWSADVDIPGKSADIIVKAVDSSYNSQPADFASIWNLRGVLSNAYHKITINVQ